MSNSHQQSLDEDVVFLPVTEDCPEFLHCESERLAVEQLMSAGPGAFYACLGTEKLGSFLSPEEVNQISGWSQAYAVSQTQVVLEAAEEGEDGVEGNGEEGGGSAERCLSSCYFPTHSDAPAPCLDLGWPEKSTWPGRDCVKVYTSPPEEGQSSIREIVRRHLQQASQVIAIVTDRLTDNAVIGDLHSAASRGVPVYIILNQRSMQEDHTHSKLRHPHMQVRVLGGKMFCSREGRMVVGQMKDNYILVDLETVIHGSYSLTWTDAHLHRQLVTLLGGPVVASFDREFRILFAASLPVPEVRAAPSAAGDAAHYRLSESSDLWYPNRSLLVPCLSPPPPPPVENPLDWEALGVFRRSDRVPDSPTDPPEELAAIGRPTQNVVALESPVADDFSHYTSRRLDKRGKQRDKTTPGENNVQDIQSRSNIQFSKTDSFNSTTAEIQQRVRPKTEQAFNRHALQESNKDVDDRTTFTHVERRKETALHHIPLHSTNQRRDHTRSRETFYEDEHFDKDEMSFRAEKQPSSRKPLIIRVPEKDNFSSLSDIMRRLQPKQSSPTQLGRGSKQALSELSKSMMDLSANPTQERGTAVPRLQANFCDLGRMTPAIALMRKRNDEVKSALYRTPNIYQPSSRPRSSTFGAQMDWRRPPSDRDADMKN